MFLILKKTNSYQFLRALVYANLLHAFLSFEVVFADQFQYQYRSARYLGRGDTGIASSSGVDAMFYNPAGIAQGAGQFKELYIVSPQVEGSEDLRSLYNKKEEGNSQALDYVLENKNKPYYLAAQNASAIVFKKLAVGVMQRASASAEVIEDPSTGMPYVNVKANFWNGGYITMAHDMLDEHFLIGVTGKFIEKKDYGLSLNAIQIDSQRQNNTLAQDFKDSERKGDALGADFGAMFIFDKATETQVGVVFRNLGMDYKWVIPANGVAPDSDPQQLDLGATTSFGTKKGRVKLFADYRDVTNIQNEHYTKHTHLGMEYNLENIFAVMAGLNQGYLTYGVALNVKIVSLEAGSYTEEMGDRPGQTPDARYFARVSLGWLL
ncbi:MAG: hypothetical protein V4591_11410 [Bdellovibrionota bacterium]